MPDSPPPIRGFRAVFTVVGGLYVLMAASMLVRGVGVLRDFGVPEPLLRAPVLEDFFLFFYELMAFVGVLIVTFGHTVTTRRAQVAAALVLALGNLAFAVRDLATSDSPFGNQLYRGDATLVFVAIDVALAAAFGALVILGARPAPAAQLRAAR